MGDMENLRAAVEDWYGPGDEDIHCTGHIECVVECGLCGDYGNASETIEYFGKWICFCCVEAILDEYERSAQ